MKAVQTFWSRGEFHLNNSTYGWLSAKDHLLSWVLSCFQLKKYFNDVELNTDFYGQQLLINRLDLPFSKVEVQLDCLRNYPDKFWALAKIQTYYQQSSPFLHVDSDVYLFDQLRPELRNSPLVAQNLENITKYTWDPWCQLKPILKYIPETLNEFSMGKSMKSCNMGIFGGSNIDLINEYSKLAFDFVQKNKSVWERMRTKNFNLFFEQVLFYQFAKSKNHPIKYQLNEMIDDDKYEGLGDLPKIPYSKYLHLLGNYKTDFFICYMLECYVLRHYPMHYKKIGELFPNEILYSPSKMSYYSFTLKQNTHLINVFLENFKSNKEYTIDESYFLGRDLLSVDLSERFLDLINSEKDFFIQAYPTLTIKDFKDKKGRKRLEIQNFNGKKTSLIIDNIDSLILQKISVKILYSDLKESLVDLLEAGAIGLKDKFVQLINNRILYFINNKILIIYY